MASKQAGQVYSFDVMEEYFGFEKIGSDKQRFAHSNQRGEG
jgi:hypothetical protein